MHTHTMRSRQAGVGLIELMVSVLVLSVGLVALARLQIDLVRSAADSRARTAAVALAEEKLEDLRSYAVVDGTDDWSSAPVTSPTATNPLSYINDNTFETAWSYITDIDGNDFGERGEGGRIVPQTVELEGVQYTLDWAVTTITYTTSLGPALGIPTDYKDVTVTVAWDDAQGEEQEVQLTGSFMAIAPGNVIAASQPVLARPPGPAILYNPGVAPEVVSVPIDVGGNRRRETTKPLPTVVGTSGTNVVQFDVVNYHQNGSQFIVDKLEEFETLNCACEVAASGPARTPARTVFRSGITLDVPGTVISNKPRGVYTQTGSNAQPLCAICCRDHHDYTEGTTEYFYDADRPNHAHYDESGGSFTPAESLGAVYDEACRLKRVNGVFQVFEDWRLDTLTILPGDFLVESETQDAYVDYVQQFVEHRVLGSSAPTKPGGRNTSLQSGASKQLFGRALYVEVPEGLADYINEKLTDNPDTEFADYLHLIPFYEINLTKLANWASYNRPVVRVTSSSVRTEAINQDAYSRGRAEAVPSGTSACEGTEGSTTSVDVPLIASLRRGNTGITSTSSIHPDDEGHPRVPDDSCNPLEFPSTGRPVDRQLYYATLDDPESPEPAEHRDDLVAVTYLPPGSPGISGDIFKSSKVTEGDPQLEVTSVRFEGTAADGACELNVVGASVDYSCVVPSGWSGSIVFSPSTLTYCADDACSITHTGGQVSYDDVTAGQAGQTVWVEE